MTQPCMAHEVGKGMGYQETDMSYYRFKDSFPLQLLERQERALKRAASPICAHQSSITLDGPLSL